MSQAVEAIKVVPLETTEYVSCIYPKGEQKSIKTLEPDTERYCWIRMRKEKGDFYLVAVPQGDRRVSEFTAIPLGTCIGGHIVGMSRTNNVYNQNNAVIGHYEELDPQLDCKLYLVRILRPHPSTLP